MKPFEIYTMIMDLSGAIKAISDIRVGKGREHSIIESDLPLMKNRDGFPIIPGSSIKGLFRGTLERVLNAGFDKASVERFVKKFFGGSNADQQEHAAAFLFHNISAATKIVRQRKHIAIDSRSQAVSHLFDIEYVPEGVEFLGKLITARNVSPLFLGVIRAVELMINDGIIKIGGFKSRGYGSIELNISEMSWMLCGIPKENLANDGVEVDFMIPTKHHLKFQTRGDGNEKQLSVAVGSNGELTNIITTRCIIASAPAFFGTQIIFKGKESVDKVMDACLEILEPRIPGYLK